MCGLLEIHFSQDDSISASSSALLRGGLPLALDQIFAATCQTASPRHEHSLIPRIYPGILCAAKQPEGLQLHA